ncbi:MAG: type II toxin-antitoxin system CcdA family antitoxin [Candidatus Thermoplasmatota archaeon]|jgi:post-segregation antitoxin (ccd killing protein)|nr:type II toxin-antitoxin system CcdA family antitoxin [Candidatus Thermoplasmatota archaeon]
MTKLVSIRVDERILAEAKRLKINYSEVMRESLKNEIERRNDKEFLESLSRIHRMLKNVDPDQLLSDLRKDRDQRR